MFTGAGTNANVELIGRFIVIGDSCVVRLRTRATKIVAAYVIVVSSKMQ